MRHVRVPIALVQRGVAAPEMLLRPEEVAKVVGQVVQLIANALLGVPPGRGGRGLARAWAGPDLGAHVVAHATAPSAGGHVSSERTVDQTKRDLPQSS